MPKTVSWKQGLPYLDPRLMAAGMGTAPSEGAARLLSNFLPFGVGDAMGVAQDVEMYARDPSSRRPLNYGLSALGMLPFVPAVTSIKNKKIPKKLYRGVKPGGGTTGKYELGSGLYSSPYKWKARLYGEVSEIPLEVGMPKNPLVIEGAGRGDAPSLLNDWLLEKTGEKNIRDFKAKYGDDYAIFLKSLGYDGVWIDDEIVRF